MVYQLLFRVPTEIRVIFNLYSTSGTAVVNNVEVEHQHRIIKLVCFTVEFCFTNKHQSVTPPVLR